MQFGSNPELKARPRSPKQQLGHPIDAPSILKDAFGSATGLQKLLGGLDPSPKPELLITWLGFKVKARELRSPDTLGGAPVGLLSGARSLEEYRGAALQLEGAKAGRGGGRGAWGGDG